MIFASLSIFIVQEIIEFNAVDNQIAEIATSSSSDSKSLWWDEEPLYRYPNTDPPGMGNFYDGTSISAQSQGAVRTSLNGSLRLCSYLFHCVNSIHLLHGKIHNNHIRAQFFVQFNSFFSILGHRLHQKFRIDVSLIIFFKVSLKNLASSTISIVAICIPPINNIYILILRERGVICRDTSNFLKYCSKNKLPPGTP